MTARAARTLTPEPLTAEAFAPFGDVIETRGAPTAIINEGRCARFSDLARLDFAPPGRAGISLFRSEGVQLPYRFDLLERHPLGSQAFIPMSAAPFLVIVAPDEGGRPGSPRAFLTNGQQGVNYLRGTWHGVLTPLGRDQFLFAVIDRIAPPDDTGSNLEEWRSAIPWKVVAAGS